MEALEKRKHHIVVVDMRLPVYSIGEQIIRFGFANDINFNKIFYSYVTHFNRNEFRLPLKF